MKKVGKMLILGALLGAVELGAAGILSGAVKLVSFEDAAFLLGLSTLVVGLLSLFGGARTHGAAAVSGCNANAQTAFSAQVAFEEQRMTEKMSSATRSRLSRVPVGSAALLAAAAVTWIGFAVSLLF